MMASSYSNLTRTLSDNVLVFVVFKGLTGGLRPSKVSNGSIEGGGSGGDSIDWKYRTALPMMLLTLKALAAGHPDKTTVSVCRSYHRPVIVRGFVLSEISELVGKTLSSGSPVSRDTPL